MEKIPSIDTQTNNQTNINPVLIDKPTQKLSFINILQIFVILFVGMGIGYVLGQKDTISLIKVTLNSKYAKLSNPEVKQVPTSRVLEFPTPTPIPVTMTLEDLAQETVKSVANIDISNWKTFSDDRVGLKFKYPGEWEAPYVSYDTCVAGAQNCNHTGSIFGVSFDKNTFSVGGTSRDFSAQRSGSALIFNGFDPSSNNGYDTTSSHNFWWKSGSELCQTPELLTCRINLSKVYLTTSAGGCGEPIFGNYRRMLFIDRSGKTISGLAFEGKIFSENYDQHFYDWLCSSPGSQDFSADPNAKKLLDQAVSQRKLDETSALNLDTINKIFETVEVY
jgi:hypothetical protein